MCGISGIYNYKSKMPVNEQLLADMNQSLFHRGPDEGGAWINGEIGLAMRRLSIVDLSGGSQPIWNENGTIATVFNGELYNYKDLSKRLAQSGHVFKTNSDTEVIVHAYEEYGLSCFNYLQGMFAFAIWDASQRRLVLARDRMGIKPLFYCITKDGVIFGSEIKALIATGYSRQLDQISLNHYFSHFYVPTPRSIFKGINRLEPGHALVVQNSDLKLVEYWDLEYSPERFPGNEFDYIDQLKCLLTSSVKRHLQADVPVGAFLSGGLDSAAVVAEMSKLSSHRVRTFTVGFNEYSYDERPEALKVSQFQH